MHRRGDVVNNSARRRAAREANRPHNRHRAHVALARAQGCRCRPDVVLKVDGIGATIYHEAVCPLEHRGTTVSCIVPRGGSDGTPVLFDLDAAIDVAVRAKTMVMAVLADEPVSIIPEGVDIPAAMAEFCDIQIVTRLDGSTIRLATIGDDVVASMVQGRVKR